MTKLMLLLMLSRVTRAEAPSRASLGDRWEARKVVSGIVQKAGRPSTRAPVMAPRMGRTWGTMEGRKSSRESRSRRDYAAGEMWLGVLIVSVKEEGWIGMARRLESCVYSFTDAHWEAIGVSKDLGARGAEGRRVQCGRWVCVWVWCGRVS